MRIIKIWHDASYDDYEVEYFTGKTYKAVRRKTLTKTQKEFIRTHTRVYDRERMGHLEYWR